MGLTRKKIKVRGKSGKTFQRSVMVRAEAIGKRAGGKKLNSLNPWQTHHVEGVSTNTRLGERQKAYGSSGPGSDHSWTAILIGAHRRNYMGPNERADQHHGGVAEHEIGTAKHAGLRRTVGYTGANQTLSGYNGAGFNPHYAHRGIAGTVTIPVTTQRRGLEAAFRTRSVLHVPQDPNKWVR